MLMSTNEGQKKINVFVGHLSSHIMSSQSEIKKNRKRQAIHTHEPVRGGKKKRKCKAHCCENETQPKEM